MHLHTVYMEYFKCLSTLLNPLAERACFFPGMESRTRMEGSAPP